MKVYVLMIKERDNRSWPCRGREVVNERLRWRGKSKDGTAVTSVTEVYSPAELVIDP